MTVVDCPELFELEELASGTLAPGRMEETSRHAAACPLCGSRLAEVRANLQLEVKLGRVLAPAEGLRSPFPTIEGYRITREIGRGGMGVVYEAEQLSPERRVALKVVRGSEYVDAATLRLFQREIRALARLEHAGIAALYDAGCTATGEHYFAMELVRGVPLTHAVRAGDRRARLEHFLGLCEAIEFAHRRGVIHRDLKPSNVLVDAHGRVKVLDFGLAKITDQDVAHSTLVTELGVIRGTLACMSPEQARGDPSAIGLESDVYSLGVILYELLTARLPTDVSGVHLAEAARRICEEVPERPSAIDASLRGDLETIALKALEKEPARRYASVAALAEDVRRHLADEPILARAPSSLYHFRKLVARHRLAAALTTTVFVLAIGTAVWTSLLYARETDLRAEADWKSKAADIARAAEVVAKEAALRAQSEAQAQTQRAEDEAARARREAKTHVRVRDFMLDIFEAADPERRDQGAVTARELLGRAAEDLERLEGEPEVRSMLALALGAAHRHSGLYREARPLLEESVELRRSVSVLDPLLLAEALGELGVLLTSSNEHARALELHDEALAIYRSEQPEGGLPHARGLALMAQWMKQTGAILEAERLIREALAMYAAFGDVDSENVIGAKASLSSILHQQRRDDEAEVLAAEVVEARRRQGGRSVRLAIALSNLGLVKLARGNASEGEPLVRECFELKRAMLGDDSPSMAGAHSNLAWACDVAGKREESLEHYQRAIELCEREPDVHRVLLGTIWKNLAKLHLKCDRPEEALAACQRSIEIREAIVPRDAPSLGDCYDNMGQIQHKRKDYASAEEWTRKALDLYEREFGDANLRTAMVRVNLGVLQVFQQRWQEGEETLLEAFAVVEKHRNANPVAYRKSAGWIAKLYERLGKDEEAQKYRAIERSQP